MHLITLQVYDAESRSVCKQSYKCHKNLLGQINAHIKAGYAMPILVYLSELKEYDFFISIVVPRAGFEPATLGLEVLCSIQLSYQGKTSLWDVL